MSRMDYYDSMPNTFRILPLMMLVSSLAFAQAPAPVPPESANPAAESESEPAPRPSAMTARLLYQLLIGELSFQGGSANQAVEVMLDAARRTGDPALYQRAVEMAIQSRSGTMALDSVRAWRQAEPGSIDANRLELQILVGLGRFAETDAPVRATLSALAALSESEQESFILAVPTLYTRANDKLEAAQIVERGLTDALDDHVLAPAAWTSVGRMRLAAGDSAGALAAATLGQAANTASQWPVLLALQLMTNGDEPSAEALVKRYLQEKEVKPEVRVAYARAMLEMGRRSEAEEQLTRLTQRQPDYPGGWLARGLLSAETRHDDQAVSALERYLQLAQQNPPDDRIDRINGMNQARLTLAHIAERRGDYTGAESLLDQVETAEDIMSVQLRRASIQARQGRLDAARQLIQQIPVRRTEDARTKLIAEAQLLREHQQPELAYELLHAELQNQPEDEDLLYDTAMAAEAMGRIDEMERLLRQLIELNPESQAAYNALGYTLADRNIRLQEARELILKAVELAPGDPFIQDSLGWAEFRLGNRDKALSILQAAFAKRPDAEIAAHLGEVLWVLGQQEEARKIWREGQRLNPENITLQETLQRLQVSL